MKYLFIIISMILTACGGSLSEDQRKKIKLDMKQHKIVRVTDAEITETAFKNGREFMRVIGKVDREKSLDSIATANHIKIKWLVPGVANAVEIERQLVEAYLTSVINGGMEDNVQRIGADTLLYTKPVTEKLADGSETVKGIWSIRFPKKNLILNMQK